MEAPEFDKDLILDVTLEETLEDPRGYEKISNLLALAQTGILESDRSFAAQSIERTWRGREIYLHEVNQAGGTRIYLTDSRTLVSEVMKTKIFWSKKGSDYWQHVTEFPSSYKPFMGNTKEIFFMSMN